MTDFMALSSSFSGDSGSQEYLYDVFLSFRGEDTRKNFVDHVYAALEKDGFLIFRDEDELERGQNIKWEMLRAICKPRCSIVVFSEGYASSRWCLDELVMSLECKRKFDQFVFPVFYGVDLSHVRDQKGSVAKAFDRHVKSQPLDKVKLWKSALTEAANISGMVILNQADWLSAYSLHGLEMSRTTNESEDGVLYKDQIDSPLMDESNGGSGNGGIVLKKGPWTSAEDTILVEYVNRHGEGNWNAVQKHSGLFRCGKSCRLRWANHLRPNLKKGAFTPDEERLIVELHAKMGNKWARMAAHLPGRTDNEIKNYWNTRIKRRQRAGLPLYPPEVCLQALHESQEGQSSGGINGADGAHNDSIHANSFEIPDVVFDSLKGNNCVLPYVPELPDIPPGGMLMKGLASSPYSGFMAPTMHRQKRLRESTALFSTSGCSFKYVFPQFDQFQNDTSDKVARTVGLPFPDDPDPTIPLSFSVIQGSHSLSNGNSSASKPTTRAVKLELPSLQYPETDLGSWSTSPPPPLLESVDAFIQSPPPVSMFETDCTSPRNSGLLDALLHEAKTLGSANNHSSEKSSNSSSVTPGDVAEGSNLNICETEWEEYRDPISPLGHSATSLFSECTPISASGSSLDEPPPAEIFTGCNVKSELIDQAWTPDTERETALQLDYTRPDAILASEWFGNGMHESIASLLGDDLAAECKHLASGSPTSNQGLGFSSCPWNTMLPVRQMSAQHP